VNDLTSFQEHSPCKYISIV